MNETRRRTAAQLFDDAEAMVNDIIADRDRLRHYLSLAVKTIETVERDKGMYKTDFLATLEAALSGDGK